MIGKKTGNIMLFCGQKEGTVVYCGSDTYEVGHHSEFWIPIDDEEQWEPFTGTVTLSNE